LNITKVVNVGENLEHFLQHDAGGNVAEFGVQGLVFSITIK
jgi:hypothetical protein